MQLFWTEAPSFALDPHPVRWRAGQCDCAVMNQFIHTYPDGGTSHIQGWRCSVYNCMDGGLNWRVRLTCCSVGTGPLAESEITFQLRKADATARRTQPPFENLRQVSFSPLTTRRGSRRRARVPHFSLPLFPRGITPNFPSSAGRSPRRLFAQLTADFPFLS